MARFCPRSGVLMLVEMTDGERSAGGPAVRRSQRRRINTARLGKCTATMAVALAGAGVAALAEPGGALAYNEDLMGCATHYRTFCSYPKTEKLSYAYVSTNVNSHRLCVSFSNSIDSVFAYCSPNHTYSYGHTITANRKKAAIGRAYDDASLYWASAIVHWP